jgi:Leucine-rich repeat (LRR) protein
MTAIAIAVGDSLRKLSLRMQAMFVNVRIWQVRPNVGDDCMFLSAAISHVILTPMASPLTKLKPQRRWMQFSLRTGFIVVTALCVALSLWIAPLERKRWAVAAIEALHGMVTFQEATTPEPFVITFLRRWFPAVYFDEIMGVYLTSTRITDAELAQLQGLTSLRVLSLDKTRVTDAGLPHLQGLTSLQGLSLVNAHITDAALAELKGLTNLRQLDLDGTQVTDAGLVHLQGLTGLQELYLADTQVTDAGLAHLQQLTSLQGLGLINTHVTDAGLVHLQGLTSLKRLNLFNTQVTDAGVAKLQQALPSCQIYRP